MMEHPHPHLVWNNEALRQQVLETELETAKIRLEREKGNCLSCTTFREKAENLEKMEAAILTTKFSSDDESWAAAVARIVSGYLLEMKP